MNRFLEPVNIAYEQFGAIFGPGDSRVRFNLEADAERLKVYLGTYWPRTYVETHTVFDELFNLWPRALPRKDAGPIRILDIGSGTGACFCGLLMLLESRGIPLSQVHVVSMDGNQKALDIQQEFMGKVFPGWENLKIVHQRFDSPQLFVSQLFQGAKVSMGARYDFILCSKFLSEFYFPNGPVRSRKRMIPEIIQFADKTLTPYGCLYLADITEPIQKPLFLPMVYNDEIKNFYRLTKTKPDIETIIPFSCLDNACRCTDSQCFSQRKFNCMNIKGNNVCSKIWYRVFARRMVAHLIRTVKFADGIMPKTYKITDDKYCKGGKSEWISLSGPMPSNMIDAFTGKRIQ